MATTHARLSSTPKHSTVNTPLGWTLLLESLEIAALKFVFRHRTLGIRSSTTRSGVGATSRENAIALELHLALLKTLTK